MPNLLQLIGKGVVKTWVLALMVVSLLTLAGLFQEFATDQLHWAFWLTSQFRFQYLCFQLISLVALLVIFVFIQKQYRKFLLFILTLLPFLLINAYFIVPYYLPKPIEERQATAGKLKIFLINLGMITEYKPLLALINREEPDIICVVEHSPILHQHLSTKPYPEAFPYRSLRLDVQLGLYSRIPILKSDLMVNDVTVRPSLNTRLSIGKQPLMLVLSHPVVGISADSLNAQERHFEQWATTWANYPHPLLIVGDLNSTPWTPAFQSLLQKTNLRDSQLGFGVQPSWTEAGRLLAVPIDQVLVSHHFSVLKRSVGPDIGSDHLPVVVQMALKQ